MVVLGHLHCTVIIIIFVIIYKRFVHILVPLTVTKKLDLFQDSDEHFNLSKTTNRIECKLNFINIY